MFDASGEDDSKSEMLEQQEHLLPGQIGVGKCSSSQYTSVLVLDICIAKEGYP